MNTEQQQANAQVRERIWRVIGKDPQEVVEPIWIDGPHWHSNSWSDEPVISAELVLDEEGVSYADVSGNSQGIGIYSADWAMGMTGGGSAMYAEDLGDDFLYIIQSEDAGECYEWLVGVVPKTQQESVLDGLRLTWIQQHEGLGIDSYPTDIAGIDFTNPDMLRAMTFRLMGNEPKGGSANETLKSLSESLIATEFGRRIYGASLSSSEFHDRLLRYWRASVDASPSLPSTTLPPGYDDLEREELFDAWIQDMELRWRDTGEPLESHTAHALRIACQYLAMVDRSF